MPWLRTPMNACLALLALLLSALGGGRVAGERPDGGLGCDGACAVAASPLSAPIAMAAPILAGPPTAPAVTFAPSSSTPIVDPATTAIPAPALLRGCAGGPRAP